MAENTSRSVFSIHGITGMLIATVLLLSILVFLTIQAIGVQQANATNAYDPTPFTQSLDNVKMKSTDNAQYGFKDAQ
jgi:succinate dehydrogenase/fumarate reductase cytochrome b subunit